MSGSLTNGMPAQQRVKWAALRSYIAQKEAYEAQNGQPAPLTDEERTAIAVLLRPASRPGPDLGSQNWISLLNRRVTEQNLVQLNDIKIDPSPDFLQVRRQSVTFSDEARQEPRLGKAPELRWACFVTFDSTMDRFPQPGYGVDAGAPASPDFNRKQDAKQYAAKSACQWLVANGHMLPSGELPGFPEPFGSAAAQAASAAAAATPPTAAAASTSTSVTAKRSPSRSPPVEPTNNTPKKKQDILPTRSSSSLSPARNPTEPPVSPRQKPAKAPRMTYPTKPPLQTSTSASTSASSSSPGTPTAGAALVEAPEIPATKRVVELAGRLNIPVPRYVITEDTTLPGGDFWKGRADFDFHPLVPDGLGVVSRVLTKKAAKEKMAEGVLEWLLTELEKRELKRRDVLGE